MVRRNLSRRLAVDRLMESIEKTMVRRGIEFNNIKYIEERILVLDVEEPDKASRIIARVFGVSSTSPAYTGKIPFEELGETVRRFAIGRLRPYESFRVDVYNARVSGKAVEKYLGGIISEAVGSAINLSSPDKRIIIEFRGEYTSITDTVYDGVGGLPYGFEGSLVSLVSGGVDSAVATLYAMKRGASIIPVYINMYPYWSLEAVRRARESIDLLWNWIPWDYIRVYIVSGVGDLVASAHIPSRLRCLLCKATMYKAASLIASREKALGVVTGEAVGQVASQTLSNMSMLTGIADTPIYRPVAFMDKMEIVREARRFGLARLDRRVGECRLRPSHPATSSTPRDLAIIKDVLADLVDKLEDLVDNAEIIEYK